MIGVLLFALAVLVAGTFLWIKSVETSQWNRMKLRMDELRGGWGLCSARSRIPRGNPEEGNVWPNYETALISAGRITPDEADVLRAFAYDEKTVNLDAVRKAVQGHRSALTFVADGVRMTGSFLRRETGTESQVRALALLCVARSRLLALEGQPRLAAEPLLDFTRMMLDLIESRSNAPRARNEMALVLYDLKLLAAASAMTSDELRSLEAELGQLDDGYPCYAVGLPEELRDIGEILLKEASLDDLSGQKQSVFAHLRYALFPRLLKAEAFLALDQAVQEVMRVHEGDYKEVRLVQDSVRIATARSRNSIVRCLQPLTHWMDEEARERHAEIRLARAAARYRATGQIPVLRDPWGTLLLHESMGEGTITFWSVRASEISLVPIPGNWKPKEWRLGDHFYPFRIEVHR